MLSFNEKMSDGEGKLTEQKLNIGAGYWLTVQHIANISRGQLTVLVHNT